MASLSPRSGQRATARRLLATFNAHVYPSSVAPHASVYIHHPVSRGYIRHVHRSHRGAFASNGWNKTGCSHLFLSPTRERIRRKILCSLWSCMTQIASRLAVSPLGRHATQRVSYASEATTLDCHLHVQCCSCYCWTAVRWKVTFGFLTLALWQRQAGPTRN